MALPVTITGAKSRAPHVGPFLDGTDVYFVSSGSTSGRIDIWKATDPTSSFSSVLNYTPKSEGVYSIDVLQDGSSLHVVHSTSGASGVFSYYTRISMGASPSITQSAVNIFNDGGATTCPVAIGGRH